MMTTTTTTRPSPRKTRTSAIRIGLLLAPFLAVFVGGRMLASAYADVVDSLMAALASTIDEANVLSQTSVEKPTPDRQSEPPKSSDHDDVRPEPHRTNGGSHLRETLFIPAGGLLRLTARQLSGINALPTADATGRTAGLSLSGVQGLGLGLLEGDVVASINGRPTTSRDAAVAIAISVWRSGEKWAQALLLRRGTPIAVSVEVPAFPK